jgi:asparaginyl-tRNA synthetase
LKKAAFQFQGNLQTDGRHFHSGGGRIGPDPRLKQPFELKATKSKSKANARQTTRCRKSGTLSSTSDDRASEARTNTFSAVFRIRSIAAFAVHKFFSGAELRLCQHSIIPAATAKARAKCSG